MDEIDRHSPSLTVEETMRFAYQTLGAGTSFDTPVLLGFILFFRFATFYALERINYSTR